MIGRLTQLQEQLAPGSWTGISDALRRFAVSAHIRQSDQRIIMCLTCRSALRLPTWAIARQFDIPVAVDRLTVPTACHPHRAFPVGEADA